ncbi:M20/M25/M40 family metallo-hydrolase [Flavitalea sp.]|nr:M20/M25/M40 family metallo-hydrolase [Flavitalea sp.]
MRKICISVSLIALSMLTFGQEKIDQDMMQKIRAEGLNNSKVMDIVFQLTDVNGPRLMNSPGYLKAANYAKTTLAGYGLENSKLESWGEWGKGWELQKSYVAMTAPYYRPLIAFPKTWTGSTNGLQTGELLLLTAKTPEELKAFEGKLKGKIIIFPRTDTLIPTYTSDASRFTSEQLQTMADYDPKSAPTRAPGNFRQAQGGGTGINLITLKEMAAKEGAIAIISTTPRGRDGTLFVQGGGAYSAAAPANFLDIVVAFEEYMSLYRLAAANVPVKLELDVKSRFTNEDTKGYNVIAEIKGTDKNLKDEIVMLGGHLDSWHASHGATDNAAGCAVMMEAVRILKTLGVKPRRTIRIALWGGEEQGLHGSRNYVKNHFTDTTLNPRRFNKEGDKVSGYFNLDNGTGKIRGIYTQGNAGVKDIFKQWLTPFNDLGATTVTLQNTGGTDHQAFDGVFIPGFQFIQDPVEYNTRTHHTNMDGYDHLQADDLKQAATIIAAFVYNTAQRDEKLPRKPFQ